MSKDLGDIIYNHPQLDTNIFVEKHGTETLMTLIAIVHK